MFFLAEKLGKTIAEVEEISRTEFLQWNVYFDPETWRKKLNNTPEAKAQAIKNLILGSSKNG